MARFASKPPPRLPLFDRLLQGDSIETDKNAERAMRELREGVRRDLEILFNTRPRRLPADRRETELSKSVLSFGLPELQNQQLATVEQQELFRKRLEQLIRRFEPRFQELTVDLIPQDSSLDRTLRFRLRAVLKADASGETVVYDTVVDPATGGLLIINR
ncbi:type VI secretion system baseplate subunit TssE [Nitratireductor sp. GCM10026969]|uniref:type VI secretion system baseplate subunit TssE n=1 Tax=Nitratireductor sp. GCM10026969 TaxID=3252645 RepID=UPI003623BFE6